MMVGMPMCGWCGSVAPAPEITELQNGPTVLRLCARCAQGEEGRKLAATLPAYTPSLVAEDPDDEPRPPATWLRVTALVLLLALVLPLAVAILAR